MHNNSGLPNVTKLFYSQYLKRILFQARKGTFHPILQFLPFYDDLFGTRASAQKVAFLYNIKADMEGHMTNFVADSIFRVVLEINVRRRGENPEEFVRCGSVLSEISSVFLLILFLFF